MAKYTAYYYDNDRHIVIIAMGLCYHQAVSLCQKWYSQYSIDAQYKAE